MRELLFPDVNAAEKPVLLLESDDFSCFSAESGTLFLTVSDGTVESGEECKLR